MMWGANAGQSRLGFLKRARQNVILELGFFLGKLGRCGVMSLSRQVSDFDLPSDYSGVIFTPFDDLGHWRVQLVRELRAAKYYVDANKLL
jgi:predicted nucleotide-binding protein